MNGDGSDALYEYDFKPKRPHERKRPLLSDPLERMQSWVKPLKDATDAEFVALGARLEGMITATDAALEKQAEEAAKKVAALKQKLESK